MRFQTVIDCRQSIIIVCVYNPNPISFYFRKYTPYWTWEDVQGLRFVYHPESYKPVFISPLDYETYDEYAKAQQELGFEYEITIYRDYPGLEILNDPDFESVFELFRAHTSK